MVVVRFKVHCQPDKTEQVDGRNQGGDRPSRAVDGVISFDIGRDVSNPDSFIATEVYANRAALERQESLREVAKTLEIVEGSVAAEPEATVFHVSSSEPWGA